MIRRPSSSIQDEVDLAKIQPCCFMILQSTTRPLTMGSIQEAAMLHGGEIFKHNQPEHEKQEPEERQANDMGTQADRPSITQALPTPSAQANRDASIRLPIEIDKEASVPSNNVSVLAVSERSETYRTSGDDADRSATASPPSEQDYAANMLRSPVTYQWNDSGDDDEDPLFEEDSYLWSSQRRPSSPSRSMKSVSTENKRHQHSIPRRVRPTPFRDADDDESISDSDTTFGIRGGDLPRYVDTDWMLQYVITSAV